MDLNDAIEKKVGELVEAKLSGNDYIFKRKDIEELVNKITNEKISSISKEDIIKILEKVMPDFNSLISKEVKKHLLFLSGRITTFLTKSFRKMEE